MAIHVGTSLHVPTSILGAIFPGNGYRRLQIPFLTQGESIANEVFTRDPPQCFTDHSLTEAREHVLRRLICLL
jgi:hypothetical protein